MTDQASATADLRTAFIALSFHSFGWGDTEEEARKNCRGNVRSEDLKKHGMITYRVHPKSELSLIDGSISYPEGWPPVKVQDGRPVTWVKAEGKSYRATVGRNRTLLLTYQPEPLSMWQVLDGLRLVGGIGGVDLKEAKAYTERLLKPLGVQ